MSLATRIAQEFNDVRNHLPISTPYNLLQGSLSISNEVITNGFSTTLYTGNGGTQVITDNVDMSTQWGNDVSEKFGGLRWLKSRSVATNNFLFDTIRGVEKEINSNTTEAEATLTGSLTAFGNTGFSVGSAAGINTNLATYVSWNFQTTHRVSGTTNHGKAYTCHYNPFTGFTIVKYEGSGISGHEIPHHLGRKLGFWNIKDITSASNNWATGYREGNQLKMNLVDAESILTTGVVALLDNVTVLGNSIAYNTTSNQHIMYGWANSYFDESNKLIGNYELVPYQGTGAAGNKVKTKGKPAWVMTKRTDVADGWLIYDNQRGDNYLSPYTSAVEGLYDALDFNSDGFTLKQTTTSTNAAGGQYIALVAYDTNSNGGGSYYPLASDTANVQINNALIPLAQGIDSNGAKNTILSKNETITGLTYTQGKNYVYCDKNGSYGVTPYKPRYLESELVRTYAGESPDYYDVAKNKWFSTSGQGELVTNGTFDSNTTGWSTDAGMTLSVSNGMLVTTAVISSSGYTYQSISTVVGKTYRLKAFINNVNMYQYGLLINDSSNTLFTETITATGGKTYDVTFVAQSTTTNIKFFRNSTAANQTLTIDNVTCFATDIVPTTEITNSRNYLNHIVHADNDGGVLYVEELPKIEYKDIVKANEFRGKNACTACVNADGTTINIMIKDSTNIGAVIRTAVSVYDIYFEKPMDSLNYSIFASCNGVAGVNRITYIYTKYIDKVSVIFVDTSTNSNLSINPTDFSVHVYGGRN